MWNYKSGGKVKILKKKIKNSSLRSLFLIFFFKIFTFSPLTVIGGGIGEDRLRRVQGRGRGLHRRTGCGGKPRTSMFMKSREKLIRIKLFWFCRTHFFKQYDRNCWFFFTFQKHLFYTSFYHVVFKIKNISFPVIIPM